MTSAQATMKELDQHLRRHGWTLIPSDPGSRIYGRHNTELTLGWLQENTFQANSFVRRLGRRDLREDELLTGYTGPEAIPAAFFSISVEPNGFDVEERVGDETTRKVTKRRHSCGSATDLYELLTSRADAVVASKMVAP